jgi:uncharacterized protein
MASQNRKYYGGAMTALPLRSPLRLHDALRTLRECERDLRAKNIVHAGIFGSVARGDAGPNSDIDVLVEFAAPPRLLDLGGVHYILETAFGEPVDLLEPAQLLKIGGEAAVSEVRLAF